ncbi:unnamed protein product [Clonostachys chloroleuca]|uniref:Uncharacterized protein n=1 Tax=Clonostachys chloroleuca TaxID=1926264 RepID=A0AA35Q400_9HYPO|nr:unnamed protein product [Clonostachys chloroleuca]
MVYIGIDAGTTRSCVFANQECVLIHRKRTFDSMVRITKDITWSLTSPDEPEDGDRCVLSLPKLAIGRDLRDGKLKDHASEIPHLIHTPDGPQYEVFGRRVSPLEVVAFIMGKMYQAIHRMGDERDHVRIDRVVVAVPSYFNWEQCEHTRFAAIIAGFDEKTIRIIQEPILSYISEIHRIEKEKECIILDIGGGTTDISLVQTEKNVQTEEDVHCMLATAGDTRLGGAHFDNELVNNALEKSGKTREGLTPDKMRRLVNECRNRKEDLSDAETTTILCDGINQKITREDARQIFHRPLEEVHKVMLELLEEWKPAQEVEQLLCVGGSIPTVGLSELWKDVFPKAKCIRADAAGEAVALGASLAASNPCQVRNVQPQDIRLLTTEDDGESGTTVLNQKKVFFCLLEGKFENPLDNKELGSFWVKNIPKSPRKTSIKLFIKVTEPGEMVITASIKNKKGKLAIHREEQITQLNLERLKGLTRARLDGKSDIEFEEGEHGAGDGKGSDLESDAEGEADSVYGGPADSEVEAVDGESDADADSDGQNEVTEVTGNHLGPNADSASDVGAEDGVNADSDSQGHNDEDDDENDIDADGEEVANDAQQNANDAQEDANDVQHEACGSNVDPDIEGRKKRRNQSPAHRARISKRSRD